MVALDALGLDMPGKVDLDLRSTSGRPVSRQSDGGRRARPGGRHCAQRLGKGPVGRLAPRRPRTPIRERHQAPRDLLEV